MPFQKGIYQGYGFKKGNKPWNKNTKGIMKAWNKGKKGYYKHSKKTRIRMSIRIKKHLPKTAFKKGFIPWNKGKHFFGKSNPHWKGGRIVDNFGYILIKNRTHPFTKYNHYVYEHRLVMEKIINRYLKPEERVHHLNRDKQDNREENLKLFVNESEHQKFHKNQRILCP